MPPTTYVEGIVLAKSRESSEDFNDYLRHMSSYYHPGSETEFADRSTMPHFWTRRICVSRKKRRSASRSRSWECKFVRACHKHPFDQWTKQDFDQFSAFFTRISYGTPRTRESRTSRSKRPGPGKKKNNELRKELPDKLKKGKTVPWQEVSSGGEPGAERQGETEGRQGQTSHGAADDASCWAPTSWR